MIYFSKYAEQKFEILNRHKVFYTREQIEDAVNLPDKVRRRTGFWFAQKENVKVVYKKDGEIIRIITFYPVK